MNAGATGASSDSGQITGSAGGSRQSAGPLQTVAAIACSLSALACFVLLLAAVVRLAISGGADVDVHWVVSSHAASNARRPPVAASEPRIRGQIIAPAEADSLLASVPTALSGFGSALDDPALDQRSASGPPATAGSPTGDVGRANRWQVLFSEGLTELRYAQQLDALGIELGVLNADGQIQYVSELTLSMPTVRTGPASAESRLYLTWSRGDLIETDRSLMAKAGIDVGDRVVLHFCSAESEKQLAESEQSFADKQPNQIVQTRFVIKPWLGGYRFVVLDQALHE